jgi:hypothetical protein
MHHHLLCWPLDVVARQGWHEFAFSGHVARIFFEGGIGNGRGSFGALSSDIILHDAGVDRGATKNAFRNEAEVTHGRRSSKRVRNNS